MAKPSAGEWSRDQLIAYADHLIAAARTYVSPNGSQILLPGAEGGYGRAVDGLEGFTRTLLLVGFRIAGSRGTGVNDLIDFCVRGITAGVDPDGDDRWVLLTEHAQAKVEAASIALILDLTRPWVWERLDEQTRDRVIDYLAPVVGDATYPPTNWLWFRVVVQTFLRSVGGPWSQSDIDADLALHDSFARADGWISDGAERSYDHYAGWALHLYPVLWSKMQGAAELAGSRTAQDVAALDRFLTDAIALIGADGGPLLQGRSLIYRFAAAAPFWAGVIAEVPSISAGALRHAATSIVEHFDRAGVPGDSGVLTLGWHHEWRALAQSYSGPGSPYWASKGLLGIALPADHPVWAAPSAPLPVETKDTLRVVAAPGWVISGTHSDGVVRVINHGTDHALSGVSSADSPLYARIGYSTATSPLLDDESWVNPVDQSVAFIDAEGRATHRAGMRLIAPSIDHGVAVIGSSVDAHWLHPRPSAQRHGSGLLGDSTHAGSLVVYSIVRGAWEARVVRVDALDDSVVGIRVGGWPLAAVAAAPAIRVLPSSAQVVSTLTSSLHPLIGSGTTAVIERTDASPLGAFAAVPTVTFAAVVGEWTASLVTLTAHAPHAAAAIELEHGEAHTMAIVTWPDGQRTTSRLPYPETS